MPSPNRESLDSVSTAPPVKKGTRPPRSLSASEIARNVKNFETWATYQGCEQVAYSDVPKDLRDDVTKVFTVDGLLPASWASKLPLPGASAEFCKFLRKARKSCRSLFSKSVSSETEESLELLDDLRVVFKAWKRLRSMREIGEKVSEADFVANVYEVFRSPALSTSSYRAKCTISLPQPQRHLKPKPTAARILNAKTAIPDCAVFIASKDVRELSAGAQSPFKALKRSELTTRGRISKSFESQSTPCAQLPSTPCFEFASSFWEDKKPLHQMLTDAYRQNRMSTAAAIRHLHSLHVRAPVFGLIWSDGTVRAHVDWCSSEHGATPIVQSAPFPGLDRAEEAADDMFHEWCLDDPGDIIKVWLLIRNIDAWTSGRFRERIIEGVHDLKESVITHGSRYQPWKRAGSVVLAEVRHRDENQLSSPDVSAVPAPTRRSCRQRQSPRR